MNGEGRAARIPHVDALDGARGVAVAGVLLFHGGHLLGGYLGVDFFFVLSGYLITSLLLAESSRTGHVGLGGFWSRRARRLLPALAVLMAGTAIYCIAFATPDQLTQIRGDAFATLGYVANWREIFSHHDYFALFSAPSPLNHTWSLAIEEQFYVIWPLMFVALLARFKHATPKAVLVTTLTLAAGSSALMIAIYDPANTNRAYFGTDTRAAAILFGAALAAWLTIHGPTTSQARRVALEALGLAGVAALAIAWTRLDGQSPTLYHGGFLLCGLAATTVIAAAVHPQPGPISRALSLKPLCALGLISYGVYLYHWPIDVALDRKQMGFGGWPLLTFQTTITLAIAIASYKIIEQPIRHGALTTTQLRKLTPAIATALVIAIFTTTLGARTPPPSVALERHPLLAATRAFQHARSGATRVLVVGDSVALYLGVALTKLQRSPPLAVLNEGVPGCVFPPQISAPRLRFPDGRFVLQTPCDPSWEAETVKAFRPAVVLWVVSGGRGGTYHGRALTPCTPEYALLYRRSLAHEVSILARFGADVVITTAAYERAFLNSDDRATDCDNRLRRSIAAATGARLADLFGYICPQGRCREKQNGVTLRPDGLHYAGAGGKIVAQWLIDQVR